MTKPANPILIGCCGWSYPDWEGPFYPEGMVAGDYLDWYAGRFPIVEVDSTFYRPPTPRMVRTWRERTPDGFKFALKVPKAITHEKQLRDCEAEVEGFVSSIEPLGDKLMVALLQMGYFNRGAFGSLEDFLETLGPFLAAWPHEAVPLAVEIRNRRWVGPDLMRVLSNHGAAFTLTEHQWMPTLAEVEATVDPITAAFSYVRLLGDREAIEKVTSTWDKPVLDKTKELGEAAGVMQRLAARVPVVALINNHYAGHSPETARELRSLLGQPEPVPPARTRTTLFD